MGKYKLGLNLFWPFQTFSIIFTSISYIKYISSILILNWLFKLWQCYKKKFIEPYPGNNILSRLSCLLFTSAAYIQMHFRLLMIIEANTMNPDQTAPLKGAVWSVFILFAIKASIVYKQISEQRNKGVNQQICSLAGWFESHWSCDTAHIPMYFFPTIHDFCCLLSNLFMNLNLDTIYWKQYRPRSDCSLRSS